MENKHTLFREEAIKSRLERSLGHIRINIPLNYKLVSAFSLLLLGSIVLFLSFGEISEKIAVQGYLDADKGIVTIHSELGGIILKSHVEEGQRVNKGDTLFVLSNKEHDHTKALIENLNQRIINLQKEYQLKNEHYASLLKLYEKHYVPVTAIKSIEAELLEISNQIKTVDLEVMKYKQSLYQLIKAPVEGLITNILYQPNQIVNPSKPLLQIIPSHSKLVAQLYVPAANIGFLKKNRMVSIQYDAYPAARFGSHRGRIQEVNLTILTDGKEDKPIKVGQPYYKIKARLENSYINLYGRKTPLNYGMTLTAIIPGETKKIWQWIVDPIYSYYGEPFNE